MAHFVAETGLRVSMRAKLKGAPDIARSLSRLVVGRGGPRDLAAIRDGIEAAASLAAELTAGGAVPLQVQEAATALRGPDAAIARELTAALDDELPLFKRDGGFVRAGYDAALDEARALRKGTREVIAALEARYAERDRRAHAESEAQQPARLFRRGAVAARRETSAAAAERDLHPPHDDGGPGALHHAPSWASWKSKIVSAADRALGIELATFERLAAQVTAATGPIKEAADALASLDVAAALAQLAVEQDYVRPEVDGSHDFVIEGGRHPVVEQALVTDGGPFVANDCDLSPLPAAGGRDASACSPAPTWRASRRSCARTR